MEQINWDFEKLEELVANAKAEKEKFLKGNKAAGTRLRKHLLAVSKTTKVLRDGVQAVKYKN